MNCSSQQITLKRLDKAFKAFFARCQRGEKPGFPCYKSLARMPSIGFKRHGDGWRFTHRLKNEGKPDKFGVIRWDKHGTLKLQGIGHIGATTSSTSSRSSSTAMEAVLLIGIQASGKSTFCRERFFDTHVRISLDLLRTRHREQRLLALCLETRQPFVVDKTNASALERARFIQPARAAGFRVSGYFFEPDPQGAAERNQRRPHPVPAAGLFGTLKRLERPTPQEGFDALWRVRIRSEGGFEVLTLAEAG